MEIQNKFIGMISLGVLYTFTTSLDEMLKNPDIKAMAISTPAATHYEIVKQSLIENVFVEKFQG